MKPFELMDITGAIRDGVAAIVLTVWSAEADAPLLVTLAFRYADGSFSYLDTDVIPADVRAFAAAECAGDVREYAMVLRDDLREKN